jgi:hypothetical protein
MCRAGYASCQANHRWDKIGKTAASFIERQLRNAS